MTTEKGTKEKSWLTYSRIYYLMIILFVIVFGIIYIYSLYNFTLANSIKTGPQPTTCYDPIPNNFTYNIYNVTE